MCQGAVEANRVSFVAWAVWRLLCLRGIGKSSIFTENSTSPVESFFVSFFVRCLTSPVASFLYIFAHLRLIVDFLLLARTWVPFSKNRVLDFLTPSLPFSCFLNLLATGLLQHRTVTFGAFLCWCKGGGILATGLVKESEEEEKLLKILENCFARG